MSFQTGLSGLFAANKNLSVIGNNISNASTVGYKMSNTQFADLYANSMNLSGSNFGGIGVFVPNVAQQFTQGDIKQTDLPLNIAINGDGFFRLAGTVDTNEEPIYTRNGEFQLDKDGYIVNPTANYALLTGWPAGVNGGNAAPLQIDTSNLPARITTKVETVINLDSRENVISPVATDQSHIPFDVEDPLSYHSGSGVTVFDSLGNSYQVNTYYVKSAVTEPPAAVSSTWRVYTTIDGDPYPTKANLTDPHIHVSTLTFDSNGMLLGQPNGQVPNTAAPVPPPPAPAPTLTSLNVKGKPGAADFHFTMDYTRSTQTGSAFVNLEQRQDGYAPGTLMSFNVSAQGEITGSYSNGEHRAMGQVLLVNFANPNGLQAKGDNVWVATAAAGEPLINKPGAGRFGLLKSRALEQSNVDMTEELVNMIVAQRVYQANAQTIKTQDTIMGTIVQMR